MGYYSLALDHLGLRKRENLEWLQVLISDEADLNEFQSILRNSFNEGDAVKEFHEKKIERQSITEEEFVRMFDEDPRNALEQLFLVPVKQWLVQMFNEKIDSGQLTVSELYRLHKKWPYRRPDRFIY
jgi:hypothetical protein